MSFSIDVNLLVYASDEGSPHHQLARSFLDRCVAGRELLCIAWSTAMSYVRIVTHPGILAAPLHPSEALTNLSSLIELPNVRMLTEQPGFIAAYIEVTGGEPFRGRLVPDAHLAAILLQNDVRKLFTNDSGFRRFSFLTVQNPLAA